MKARLRELDEPVYGDKHTLWTRLKKAEAALNARRAKARTMWRSKAHDSKHYVRDENQMWHLSLCLRRLSQRRWKDIWQRTCHQPHGANSV